MIEHTLRVLQDFVLQPWGPLCKGMHLNDEAQVAAILGSRFADRVVKIPNPLAPLQGQPRNATTPRGHTNEY